MQLGERTLGQCLWGLIHTSTANRHMGLCAFISILFCLYPRIPVCLIHAIPDCPCVDIWWSTHEQTALVFIVFVCLLASDRFSLWLAWTFCVVEVGLELKAIMSPDAHPCFLYEPWFQLKYTWPFLDKGVTFCKHIVPSPISPEVVQNSIKHTLLGLPL